MERIDAPTPNGGAYSIAIFTDNEGNEVDKTKATRIMIQEFSANDELIETTHGVIGNPENNE